MFKSFISGFFWTVLVGTFVVPWAYLLSEGKKLNEFQEENARRNDAYNRIKKRSVCVTKAHALLEALDKDSLKKEGEK